MNEECRVVAILRDEVYECIELGKTVYPVLVCKNESYYFLHS